MCVRNWHYRFSALENCWRAVKGLANIRKAGLLPIKKTKIKTCVSFLAAKAYHHNITWRYVSKWGWNFSGKHIVMCLFHLYIGFVFVFYTWSYSCKLDIFSYLVHLCEKFLTRTFDSRKFSNTKYSQTSATNVGLVHACQMNCNLALHLEAPTSWLTWL